MRVTLTGATGSLGGTLVRKLREQGHEVTVLSRSADRARAKLGTDMRALEWRDPKLEPPPAEGLSGQDGVVNLLGEPVAQRWTEHAKAEIRDSRVLPTRNLVKALRDLPLADRPRVLVSQSATGWYGARGDERLTEAEPAGDDFLARVCLEWEAAALEQELPGMRTLTTRTGVVLSRDGGALERMLPPFRLGVGGPVAGGGQYVPWIAAEDVVGGLLFCLEAEAVEGPVNLTAPEPVTNWELSRALGRVLRRPAVVPVPGFAVKLLYGEMGSVVTTGQRAVPERLQSLGYRFRRPDLEDALRAATAG